MALAGAARLPPPRRLPRARRARGRGQRPPAGARRARALRRVALSRARHRRRARRRRLGLRLRWPGRQRAGRPGLPRERLAGVPRGVGRAAAGHAVHALPSAARQRRPVRRPVRRAARRGRARRRRVPDDRAQRLDRSRRDGGGAPARLPPGAPPEDRGRRARRSRRGGGPPLAPPRALRRALPDDDGAQRGERALPLRRRLPRGVARRARRGRSPRDRPHRRGGGGGDAVHRPRRHRPGSPDGCR